MQSCGGGRCPAVRRWEELDLNYRVIASVDQEKCIGCGLCYVACEDGAHQAIGARPDSRGRTEVQILEDKCVGCNLCSLVCPVSGCITMKQVDGSGQRPGLADVQPGSGGAPARPQQPPRSLSFTSADATLSPS